MISKSQRTITTIDDPILQQSLDLEASFSKAARAPV
jgi:hypothetical protein